MLYVNQITCHKPNTIVAHHKKHMQRVYKISKKHESSYLNIQSNAKFYKWKAMKYSVKDEIFVIAKAPK